MTLEAHALELARVADWRDAAACRGRATAAWYPPAKDRFAIDAAKAVCAGCLVRADCLAYALELEGEEPGAASGVWGGLTAAERRQAQAAARHAGMGRGG